MKTIQKIKLDDIKKSLNGLFTIVSQNKKNSSFIAKKCYYYRPCKIEVLVEKFLEVYTDATIVSKGDHWRPFRGGVSAGSANDSWMWIEFKLNLKDPDYTEIID